MRTIGVFLASIVLFPACKEPILYEHTTAMMADPSYQQHELPGKYILGVDPNDLDDVDDPEITINNSYWVTMTPMPFTETTGFPAGYTYYKYTFTGLTASLDSVNYKYRCEYTGGSILFPYQSSEATLGPITIKKPILLSWREDPGTTWNKPYNDNLTNNVMIEEQGCFSIADVGATKSVESTFKMRNDGPNVLYIDHQLTKIIDISTGNETTYPERFVVELLDAYTNNLINLSPNGVVNFKIKYVVTIAGPGNITDLVKIRFFFGDTNSSFPRTFHIGADLKFIKQTSCP